MRNCDKAEATQSSGLAVKQEQLWGNLENLHSTSTVWIERMPSSDSSFSKDHTYMKCQGSDNQGFVGGHQSNQPNQARKGKRSVTTLSRRMGLSALLLLLGGGLLTGPVTASAADNVRPTASLTAQIPTNATVLYVNPTLGVDEPNRGSSDNLAFRSITYALGRVQSSAASTVIQLAPGSYTRDTGESFPLVLQPNVILRGEESNKGQTVLLIGGGSYVSPTFASQNVTIRALNNSSIRGLTVTNPNSRGTAIWVESTNPTIRNSTLSNSLRDGVFVTGTGAPTIEGNIFMGNSGNGVSVARSAQGVIRGNVFQNTGFGIAVGDASTPRIENNQLVQNTDGVVISNTARPVLRKNVIENNTRDGVVAIASAQPDLGTADSPGENLIRNNGRHDLYNATRSNTILAVGNQIDPGRIAGTVDFVARDVAAPSNFSDVQGNWAQAYIEALASRDIIGGFPDGTYRPNDPVTRAQFAAIINKAFNPVANRAGINFVDVSNSFWGYQAIQSAYRGGFLSGYPGQVFRADQRIPRVQVLVSLSSGLGIGSGEPAVLSRYQDAAQVPDWARGSTAAATQRNIVVNYPAVGQLNPNREATRAEVAAFVYQALVSAGQAEAIPSPYAVIVQPENVTQSSQP